MDSDYPFEKLGPDRFQRLAQVMIAAEFPDTQAFPLRKPDGGRDSVAYQWNGDRRAASVFQVKFVEKPDSLEDPHKWVLETAEAEAKKVAALIPKGAESYTLVTNVGGTGHADAGSIDRLDSILTETVGIPARGWWRDDLITRMKANSQFRWEFPDLLTGVDVLQMLVESDLTEEKDRRSSAIRAYLTQQFEEDRQVRFKQVDLQKDLLGLFVDIPMSIASDRKRSNSRDNALLQAWIRLNNEHDSNGDKQSDEDIRDASRRFDFPATHLLLDGEFQERLPQVVVEGAPGQGKSTITQYLCQVHRMRLLEKEVSRLPERHTNAPLRLPFRIDLRDLATWFQGKDPFTPDQDLQHDDPRTVEGFIAASISHHSGGVDFDVADLLAVIRSTAVVAVFDGLDEVADIETRKRIVDELTTTARRLEANSLAFQMIVTSRPAAFAKSPGFDRKTFRHVSLEAITPAIATEYSENWIKARQLTPRDARDVKRVLETKLKAAHMRELARNTMQLTILLSLIYARGSSLPDKRTALYGAYIDTFLNRESEKSAIVREHRDLLVSLHGYLAWVLHSDAEQGSGSGRISRDDLTTLLEEYLQKEGHDTSLVDKLFEGVVTRVVAVVSRVEGLYEFEVQPLREYFAARFLYETARYSPTGEEVAGTLPDRFVALARNPYWLNVARFYAGFLSKGEIPSLVESLKDLCDDKEFSTLRQPRVLASMLLADWVFSQNPRSLDDVVNLVAVPLNVQVSRGNTPFRSHDSVDALPTGSGREELTHLCFAQLESTKNVSFARALAGFVVENAPQDERKDRWLRRLADLSGAERTRWIQYGRALNVVEAMSGSELDSFLGPSPEPRELMEVLAGGQGQYLQSDRQRCEATIDAVLAGRWRYMINELDESVLNRLGFTYAYTHHRVFPGMRHALSERRSSRVRVHGSELLSKCEEIIEARDREIRPDRYAWDDSLRPWESLIELSRELFGERWIHYILAIEASGIKSAEETGREAHDLFDSGTSLAQRARYARLRAGNPKWWGAQLGAAKVGDERLFAVALLFSKASARTIDQHMEQLESIVRGMSADEFTRLSLACNRGLMRHRHPGEGQLVSRDIDLPKDLSVRTIEILSKRASGALRRRLYDQHLSDYAGKRPALLDICIEHKLTKGREKKRAAWSEALPLLRRSPSAYFIGRAGTSDMPTSIAREICSDAASFDSELVYWAENKCVGATRFDAVSKVAMRQKWFEV